MKFSSNLAEIWLTSGKFWEIVAKLKLHFFLANFDEIIEIQKRSKGVHSLDLGETTPTSIYLQNLASIQPRTRVVKFARSPRTDP